MQANSLKDLLQSKIDDLEKQVLSRVNSLEEGKTGLRNETEQRGRVESTLTSLHQRITDLEKGKYDGSTATFEPRDLCASLNCFDKYPVGKGFKLQCIC